MFGRQELNDQTDIADGYYTPDKNDGSDSEVQNRIQLFEPTPIYKLILCIKTCIQGVLAHGQSMVDKEWNFAHSMDGLLVFTDCPRAAMLESLIKFNSPKSQNTVSESIMISSTYDGEGHTSVLSWIWHIYFIKLKFTCYTKKMY